MFGLLVSSFSVVLAAAPATPPPGSAARILVLDLEATDVAAGEVALLQERVALRLSKMQGVQAISQGDMKRLIELEATKMAAGCDVNANSSCLAEVAGALGAQFVLTGKVGRIGDRFVLNLTLLDGAKAESRARSAAEGNSPSELLTRVDAAVEELVAPVAAGGEPPGEVGLLWWSGAGAAGVGGVVLVVGGVWSVTLESTLSQAAGSPASKEAALAQRGAALATLAAGAVLAAAGGTMLAFTMME